MGHEPTEGNPVGFLFSTGPLTMLSVSQVEPGTLTGSVDHLIHLLAVHANVRSAIVEAQGFYRLLVRVPAYQVIEVSDVLHKHWLIGWHIEVVRLDAVEENVDDIYVFAGGTLFSARSRI
jgi:hypothetical protein